MLYCKVCGHVLREGVQKCSPRQAERMGVTEFKLVTCDNPLCAIRGYTLSEQHHFNEDLTPYLRGKDNVT